MIHIYKFVIIPPFKDRELTANQIEVQCSYM